MIDRYPLDLTNKRYAILYIRKGIYLKSRKDVKYISDHLLKSKDFSNFAAKKDMNPEAYVDWVIQKTIKENQYIMNKVITDLNTNRFELGI